MSEKIILINKNTLESLIGYINKISDFIDIENFENEENKSLVTDGYNVYVQPVLDILRDPEKTMNPFKFVKQEEVNDFRYNLEDIYDTDVSKLTDEEIEEILDDVEDTLANDDYYNECYNDAVWKVLKEKGIVK